MAGNCLVVLLEEDILDQEVGMAVALKVCMLPVGVGSLLQWVGLAAALVVDNLKKITFIFIDGFL